LTILTEQWKLIREEVRVRAEVKILLTVFNSHPCDVVVEVVLPGYLPSLWEVVYLISMGLKD